MPRKMIGPKLPKGGYKSLITKKKLAETATIMAALAGPAIMARRGRGRPRRATSTLNNKKPRRKATPAQLAALAKARAARRIGRRNIAVSGYDMV